jgi:two-component system sensor histidine kinase KdpD
LHRDELVRQAREARALAKDNRARTALLAAVSHDLRTPLASIKAASSSLRQPDVVFSDADRADLLETIEESTDRLTVLVANLLDMSRLQSGSVVPRMSAVDIDEAVSAAAAPLVDGERVRISMDDALPPAAADAGLLDRVLANVLENALKHSGAEVVVHAAATGSRLQVRVVDRGRGVPEGAKDAIFAPFQRYGDTPRGTGVGLGLAVARGLMEAMGGSIAAEDTPGGGLTIVMELAREGGSTDPRPRPSPETPRRRPQTPRRSPERMAP